MSARHLPPLVALAAVAVLTGCPKAGELGPAARARWTRDLEGTWVDERGGRFEIDRFSKGRPFVVYVLDQEGEVFQLGESGFVEGAFTFDYTVPSTGFHVTFRVVDVDGDDLTVAWRNDRGMEGTKAYTRR